MKYKVTIANLWLDGVKHRRGDIIETEEVISPSRAEPYTEPEKAIKSEVVKQPGKRKRKTDVLMEGLNFDQDSDDNE